MTKAVQFNSYLFILALLPAFVICYFLLSRIRPQLGKAAIIGFSIWFYAAGGWDSAAILGASIVGNLLLALWITRAKRFRKGVLALTIVLNVLLLAYFKYYHLTVTTINDLGGQLAVRDLIAPLGISFFTFQQIMYAVSLYRGEPERVNVPDYLCFVLFFPKILMGPLAEPKDLISQFNDTGRKRLDWANIACGLKLFGFGLFKKLVLADTFARGVSWGFGNLKSATAGDLFLVMLCYTFQIYFDFSGYSDMATGVAKMVNIELPINFDSPYKATSVRDFWKRWHISLTSGFLTKYLYFPLGGSRKGTVRTYLNIFIVFLISGMWHGANWTFLLWGAIHGVLMIVERLCDKPLQKVHAPVRWLFTFVAVALLRMLFLTDTIAQWGEILGKMFSFQDMSVSAGLLTAVRMPETAFLIDKLDFLALHKDVRGLPMLVSMVSAFLICMVPENNYRSRDRLTAVNMIFCAIAFVWAFLCLGSESVFVYFNF